LALVEMLCIGAHAVARAKPGADEFALIIGAGPIGLSVLQFALPGAGKIAVMDVNETRIDFCRATFGVEHTINPSSEKNVEGALRKIGGGDLPTLIIDATGNATSMKSTFSLAAAGGRIVFVGLFQGEVHFDDPNFHRRELTLSSSRNATAGDFRRVISGIEDGRIDTAPWITHRLALDEVPERFPDLPRDPGLLKAVIHLEH
ncbi:MAG: zinc-binding dehydrogenase, partial [Verrucomicrobiales bacterium]